MVESKSPRPRRSAENLPPVATRARRGRTTADSATTITADERVRMVETAAYYRAERRGFVSGQEAEDWLAAEEEIDALIRSVHTPPRDAGSKPSRPRKPRSN